MKTVLLMLPLFLLLGACSGSDDLEIGQKTSMEVEPVIDMGTVQYGETIEAKFKVKNTGSYPLVLAEVKGSCSCTVADYPKDPIPPGEERTLTATISTANANPGPIAKDVRIMANTVPSLTSVLIKAKIKRK
jgi:hypothetical protein